MWVQVNRMELKSQEWIESTQARIHEAFELFDKDKSEAIVKVIFRMFKLKLMFTNTTICKFPRKKSAPS